MLCGTLRAYEDAWSTFAALVARSWNISPASCPSST
jgi:hypothetical protein